MGQHDDIRQRLGEAGSRPMPGELRASHLHQMSAATTPVATAPREKRFGRLAVAGAAIVGFMFGSTGLAMAGALPGPAQGAAHDVLSVVRVQVPDEGERRGPPAHVVDDPCKGPPEWAGTDVEPTEAQKQARAEARQDCVRGAGRPDHAGPPEGHRHDGDDCKGPPDWAGTPAGPGGRSAQAEAHSAIREACPDDEVQGQEAPAAAETDGDEDDDEGDDGKGRPDHAGPPEGADPTEGAEQEAEAGE